MTTIAEYYARIDAAWPAVVPPITAPEAARAARKLYRFARRRRCDLPVVFTTGNRFTYTHSGTLRINLADGWKQIVHNLSHAFDRNQKPHSKVHARLELRMVKEVIKRGWLAGTLKDKPKPAKPVVDPRVAERDRLAASFKRWITKQRRAETAIRKINRRLRYLNRRIA